MAINNENLCCIKMSSLESPVKVLQTTTTTIFINHLLIIEYIISK